MAGGEGTRLRPLTSNQPKPMVPIVGKPCIEHILELLRSHGLHDVLITLAFLPQAIRSYFGDGESLGISIDYSVEDSPLGTAGSVGLAADKLDATFLVISGDALCDVDLSQLITFHKEREAAVTIGLKSVENPLEFGIVVTDEDDRIERFLEKPSWGQVFSDTINTGIYVIEPEVLRHVPDDRPYDFSKELFPLLLEMGRPLYGYVMDGYWQDVGDLSQYAQANFDALDGRVKLHIPGLKIRGNIWLSENAEVDDLALVDGPALIGNYCRVSAEASVGPYSVLSANVTLRERARTARSVIDASTHIGASSLIEGAVVGRRCDIRPHVRIHEGVVIGDEVTVGSESVVMSGVLVYPNKEIESGAQIHENLIWEQRASARLFERDVISGRIDVDLTPEVAVRIAAALGTSLGRGSQVVSSRGPSAAGRMIQRAMISGLNSTGVDVADIRVLPAAVGRHLVKLHGYEAGLHVSTSAVGDELVQIRMFEHPGVEISTATQKEVEKHFFRADARRAPFTQVGELDYPARVRESYAEDLLAGLDVDSIRHRRFRLVIDYAYSPASAVTPLVLGPLKVEVVSARGLPAHGTREDGASLRETVGQAKRLVEAVGADVGVAFDVLGERIYLVDEKGDEIPVEHALLLYLTLLRESDRAGKVVLPATITSQAESLLDGSPLEIERTVGSLAELTKAAAEDGVIFGGALGGGYVFPEFLPAYDATASLCKLLELLAPVERPLSELVSELPSSTLVHRPLQCPWSMKGTVMRALTERLRGRELDLVDGIKVFDERGWAQVQPDPDEPLLYLYSEGRTEEESVDLEEELRRIVQEVMEGQEAVARR